MGIEQYYAGDEQWNRFVKFYSNKKTNFELLEILVSKLNGHTDIALVILELIGDNSAVKYLSSKPPVLDGKSPIECVQNPSLINRLREALMRFPVVTPAHRASR